MKPFGHKNFHRNMERHGGTGCVFCGKKVNENKAKWVRVVDGGKRFAGPDEIVDQSGDMGCFPMGPSCHKKYGPEIPTVEPFRDSKD